jgi:para-nitrobenzyl esterase
LATTQASVWDYGVTNQSEACLTLNVWAPETVPDGGLPVLVYWYGGAFFEGETSAASAQHADGKGKGSSASLPQQGSTLAVQGNLVVVTANYRLGALGFFAMEKGVPSNAAVRDQQAALLWVGKNIRAFGGDPARVTIGGQSAGGLSANYHMLIPSR